MKYDIVFPDEIYLATKGRVPLSTETYPLSYAIPVKTGKEFEKQKDNVQRWSRQYPHGKWVDGKIVYNSEENPYVSYTLANIPQCGFTLEKAVSRFTTDNKWFNIRDPRGFTLQITAMNLASILLNDTTIKGEFEGIYVWGREGAVWALVPTTHPDYQRHLMPPEKKLPVIGDEIETIGDKGVYLGDVYVTKWDFKRNYAHMRSRFGFGTTYEYSFSHKKLPKKQLLLKVTQKYYSGEFHLLATLPKKFKINSSGNELVEIPYNQMIHCRVPNAQILVFHATREDQQNCNFTEDEFKAFYENYFKGAAHRHGSERTYSFADRSIY